MNIFFELFKILINTTSGLGLGGLKPVSMVYQFILKNFHPKKIMLHGHDFYLDKQDSLSLSVYTNYEPGITKYLSKNVKKGDVVIDAGAHIGFFSVFLSQLVGDKGLVLSYEPIKENFNYLKKNLINTGRTNYRLFNKAVLEKNTSIFFYYDDRDSSQHSLVQKTKIRKKIDAVSLDQQALINKLAKVNFINVDVQGAEGQLFAGAKNIIKNNSDIKIICEFWPEGLDKSQYNCEKFLELITSLGLKIRLLDGTTGVVGEVMRDHSRIIEISKKGGYVSLLLQKK